MVETIVSTIIGIISGGILTWIASRYYYKKAGDELRAEAERLRKLSELVLYIQTNPQADVSLSRDDNGNVIGLIVSSAGHA